MCRIITTHYNTRALIISSNKARPPDKCTGEVFSEIPLITPPFIPVNQACRTVQHCFSCDVLMENHPTQLLEAKRSTGDALNPARLMNASITQQISLINSAWEASMCSVC